MNEASKVLVLITTATEEEARSIAPAPFFKALLGKPYFQNNSNTFQGKIGAEQA